MGLSDQDRYRRFVVASRPQEKVSHWVFENTQALHPLLLQQMQELHISLRDVEGMYEFTDNPTNMVAFVLAHEIGHALARHDVSSCVRNHAHPSFSTIMDLCTAHARSNDMRL